MTIHNMDNTLRTGRIARLAYNTVDRKLRGKVCQVVGFRGATHFDTSRVIVRLIQDDGGLGETFYVFPGLVIDL